MPRQVPVSDRAVIADARHDFRHEALFYADEDEFLASTVSFVRDGLWADEPVLVAVGPEHTAALRSELGDLAEAVQFADMEELGRNPARIIPAWLEFVAKHGTTGRPVRGIGEPIWPGRSSAELVECHHHESLLNLAFGDTPSFWLLCPYDTTGLAAEVVEEARRTHPIVAEHGLSRPSDGFVAPCDAPGPFAGDLPVPRGVPEELGFEWGQLALVRRAVGERAERFGLTGDRNEDLVLAVSELAANSILHAGGEGVVRIWCEPGTVLCEVIDRGRLDRPLAGRVRPAPDAPDGRGLWMVNQVCDLVQMRSTPDGNVVRLHMSLS